MSRHLMSEILLLLGDDAGVWGISLLWVTKQLIPAGNKFVQYLYMCCVWPSLLHSLHTTEFDSN
jgi:hypothetical protein